MDGLACLGDTWLILLRCGGLPTLLRFLCLGLFSSALFYLEMQGGRGANSYYDRVLNPPLNFS